MPSPREPDVDEHPTSVFAARCVRRHAFWPAWVERSSPHSRRTSGRTAELSWGDRCVASANVSALCAGSCPQKKGVTGRFSTGQARVNQIPMTLAAMAIATGGTGEPGRRSLVVMYAGASSHDCADLGGDERVRLPIRPVVKRLRADEGGGRPYVGPHQMRALDRVDTDRRIGCLMRGIEDVIAAGAAAVLDVASALSVSSTISATLWGRRDPRHQSAAEPRDVHCWYPSVGRRHLRRWWKTLTWSTARRKPAACARPLRKPVGPLRACRRRHKIGGEQPAGYVGCVPAQVPPCGKISSERLGSDKTKVRQQVTRTLMSSTHDSALAGPIRVTGSCVTVGCS